MDTEPEFTCDDPRVVTAARFAWELCAIRPDPGEDPADLAATACGATPAEVWSTLCELGEPHVFRVAVSAHLPVEFQWVLARRGDDYTRGALVDSATTAAEVVDWLVTNGYPQALRRSTNPELLDAHADGDGGH